MLFTRLIDDGFTAETTAPSVDAMPLYGCNCPLCTGAASNALQAGNQPGQFAATPGQTAANPASAPLATSAATAQALMAGSQWTGADASGKTVITYSFATAASQFAPEAASYAATLTPFSDVDKAMTRTLLATISAVCNVTFVEVADTGAQGGQVRYAYSQAPNDMGYAGFAFFPSTPGTGGDVWIGKAQATAQWDYYRPDLVLHETLHAIGLKHSFSGSVTLDTQSDIIPNTVMSYSAMAGSQVGALSKYPGEPMLLDVAALQALYGAAAHETGDTVYHLTDSSFQDAFRTVWDSAGKDTFDATGIGHGVSLDLREGGHSDVGAKVDANAYFGIGTNRTMSTTVYTSTVTVAAGAHIENATGTAFADTIIANDLDNAIVAGDGDDVIYSGAGADRLDGGNGDDTIILSGLGTKTVDGGAGNDKAVFASSVGNFSVTQSAGHYTVTSLIDHSVATLYNVERIEFSDMQLAAGLPQGAAIEGDLYAEAFRLYKAALDRVPDQGGLVYWTHALQSGASLSQLASNFMGSAEFQQRFGSPGNKDFVTLLYNNVLDRAPDAGGLAFHLGNLDQGLATRADVLVGFSESPENQANMSATLVGLGSSGMLFPV